jgi:hypothetical protein
MRLIFGRIFCSFLNKEENGVGNVLEKLICSDILVRGDYVEDSCDPVFRLFYI